jgi:hypothetical protein
MGNHSSDQQTSANSQRTAGDAQQTIDQLGSAIKQAQSTFGNTGSQQQQQSSK